MSRGAGVLRNGSFVRIWSGQLVSQVGDRFYAIALAVWIVERTGSAAAMAALLIASVLPGLLVGPFAGALADRWNRKAIMIAADLVRAAAVTAVALLGRGGVLSVGETVAAATIISVSSAFFSPALSASMPRIVNGADLAEANSLSQLGGGITGILGPACGALVLGLLGYDAVFAINAASFLVSACLIALSRVPSEAHAAHPERLAASVAEGMRYAVRTRDIRLVLAAVALAHFAVGGLSVALPFLAKLIVGSGARNLGWLEALQGAGLVAGALLAARALTVRGTRGLFGALALIGAGVAAAGALEIAGIVSLLPFLACCLLIGGAIAVAASFWTTLLQRQTPDALRGRIFGISTTLGASFVPFGMALAGLALGTLRFGALFAPVGAVLLVSGVLLATASAGPSAGRSCGNRRGQL